jgi:hypothetical protein
LAIVEDEQSASYYSHFTHRVKKRKPLASVGQKAGRLRIHSEHIDGKEKNYSRSTGLRSLTLHYFYWLKYYGSMMTTEKGKVIPVPKHHAIKTIRRNGGKAPCILGHGTS